MWRVEIWPGFGGSFYGVTNGYGEWRRANNFVYLTRNYAEAARLRDEQNNGSVFRYFTL